MTVQTLIDRCRLKLHDSAKILWSDDELLGWTNDGYRQLLAKSQAVRRLIPFSSPGRHTYAISHEWESRHAARGTVRHLHRLAKAGTRNSTTLWEVEHVAGITPTVAFDGFTQEWERQYTSVTDRHFRFTFPHNHERVVRLEWNNRRLSPVAVRELDALDTDWFQAAGEPRWWTTGTGRIKSVDIYELNLEDVQGYALYDYERGVPRAIDGERTWALTHDEFPQTGFAYTTSGDWLESLALGFGYRVTLETATAGRFAIQEWEVELIAGETTFTEGVIRGLFAWEEQHGADAITEFGIGTIRGIRSADRQYLALYSDVTPQTLMGRVTSWLSSEDTIMALEVIVPDHAMGLTDAPVLIPERLQKYLRFYVLAVAFSRMGEGANPELAMHYQSRFDRGVAFFRRLLDVAHRDRVWVRDEFAPSERRVPYVRLPATFPRVL